MVTVLSMIEVPTRWGIIPAKYHYLKHPTGSSHLAVLFPGKGYTLDAPVMWYSAKAAFDAGCDVLEVEYGYQANRVELMIDELDSLVEETAATLNNLVNNQYSNVVFIGKSIGTIVQTKVLQKLSFSVPNHIFLTPLKAIIPAIRDSKNALVIVGDRDSAFETSDITQVAGFSHVKLTVVPEADHGLETKDYSVSIDILKQVAILCGDFCRELL